jgi:hypothetical protein
LVLGVEQLVAAADAVVAAVGPDALVLAGEGRSVAAWRVTWKAPGSAPFSASSAFHSARFLDRVGHEEQLISMWEPSRAGSGLVLVLRMVVEGDWTSAAGFDLGIVAEFRLPDRQFAQMVAQHVFGLVRSMQAGGRGRRQARSYCRARRRSLPVQEQVAHGSSRRAGHELRQAAPEDRCSRPVRGQQLAGCLRPARGRLVRVRQAQLGPHAPSSSRGNTVLYDSSAASAQFLVADQRQQGLAQAEQVPVGDVGLLVVGVAALLVAVVADVAGIEAVEELERAVVDGQAQDAHVVGVHHAVQKPTACHCATMAAVRCVTSPGKRIGVAAEPVGGTAGRVEAVDHEVRQLAQLVDAVAGGEMLEMAEADETRRHPRHPPKPSPPLRAAPARRSR